MHPDLRKKLIKLLAEGDGPYDYISLKGLQFAPDEVAQCGTAYFSGDDDGHIFNRPQLRELLGINEERAGILNKGPMVSVPLAIILKTLRMDNETEKHVLTHTERLELQQTVERELGS